MTSRQRWTLAMVCLATFMLLLDVTIVNVALPDIRRDLHSSFADVQWVIDAYSLGLAALLLTAGSLSDRLGRRAVFVAGLVVFSCASLLCGLSGSPLMLNFARFVQGVGGSAMFATSLALLADAFHGPQRGTAFGAWGATIGGAVAVGPLVGGVLVDAFSWQAIFLVNVPIGAFAIWATLGNLAESRGPARKVDIPGLVTFSVGLFLLIFALVRANSEGWGSAQIVAQLLGSTVLLAAFVVVELRAADPMLDLTLFRKPAFAGASIAAFTLSASMFAMFLYMTLYIQNALGYDPLAAGVRFLPVSLLGFFVAPISGKLSTRMPVRILMGGGLLLVGVGLLLMSGLDAGSDWTALLAGFIVGGIGVGLTNPALASTAVGVVAPQNSGAASGINSTFRQVGIATGIAGLGAIFQSALERKLPGGPPGEVLAAGDPGVLGPGRHAEFLAGYTSALNELFVIAGIIALVGAVLTFALVRSRDFVQQPVPAPEAA
jgi:EmrB/QacA subfamily drug resistance transporter